MIARLQFLILGTLFLAGCSHDPNVRKQKYLESGERYFAKGEYSAASIQFRSALQVDPQFAAAHYQLARAASKLKDWENAHKEFALTIELQPENYSARLELANLLLAAGQLESARDQIDVLVARQPNNPAVRLVKGNLLAAEQNLPGAIEEMQKAISLEPQRGDSYLNLALVQLRNDQAAAAEINFKKAIDLLPNSTTGDLVLGGYYQSQQRIEEAERRFLHAAEIDRQDPNPRFALARLYMDEGKKADAEDLLRKSKDDFHGNSVGYRMLGDLYFASGDIEKAIAEYSGLYREHPKDPLVTKNYVQLLILSNRLEEARRLNDEELQARPGDVNALIERGQIQIAVGHPGDAVETLQAALKSDPDNGLALFHLGTAFDHENNAQEAERAWQDAVRHRPDLVEAQRALAVVALRKGNMADLEQRADELVVLRPTSPEGYAMRAFSHIRRNQLPQAEPDIQKAISVAPKDPAGYVQMGNLMFARKDFRGSEHAYRQAMDRDSASLDALSGLMNTYRAENRPDSAFDAARMQIAKAPNNSAFWDLLGTALFDHKRREGDMDEAETSLAKSVELNEHNVDAWLKLVQVEAVHVSVDKAIFTCRRLIERNPNEAGSYLLLGELFDSKLLWGDARQAFQKALELSPGNPAASHDLAFALLQTGESPDLALTLAETARRGMPDSSQAADTMGWSLYRKGAYRSAINQLQDALKLAAKSKSPDDPTVHYHLGIAYEKAGQPRLARQHLEQVLRIDPSYSRAKDVRKLLQQLRG